MNPFAKPQLPKVTAAGAWEAKPDDPVVVAERIHEFEQEYLASLAPKDWQQLLRMEAPGNVPTYYEQVRVKLLAGFSPEQLVLELAALITAQQAMAVDFRAETVKAVTQIGENQQALSHQQHLLDGAVVLLQTAVRELAKRVTGVEQLTRVFSNRAQRRAAGG